MEKIIIVAVADNLAIGRDNALLWHIKEDMKFFRKTTTGSAVVMGRNTFDSIGRALPGRLNIVLTSRRESLPEGVTAASSLEEAFNLAGDAGYEKCFVMGGGRVYSEAMPLVDKLVVTHVHVEIRDADTFFPSIDARTWTVESRSELLLDEENGYSFEFVTYGRQ